MPTVNEITAQDINRLAPTDLTTLLRKLLLSEVNKHGLALSTVSVAYVLQAPDGGEDGRVQWAGGPASTDWLPSRYCSFQCKATEMTRAKCINEVLNEAKTDVVPKVNAVLSANGTYILFNGAPGNEDACAGRVGYVREGLAQVGKAYAATADIRVYSADRIAIWCSQHLAGLSFVAQRLGMSRPLGMMTWEEWSTLADFRTPYVKTHVLEQFTTQIHGSLVEPKSVVRIQGLSGLGKTRLVFETLRPDGHDLNRGRLSSMLVYLDAADHKDEVVPFFNDVISRGLEGLVVVDNCPQELHDRLAQCVARSGSRLKLITIDYSLDAVQTGEPLIKLEPKELSQVVHLLLAEAFPQLNEGERRRVEQFAQGFPRLAVLIANSRLRGDAHIGQLTDREMVRRLLWAHDQPDDAALRVLEACAVFTRFGFKGETGAELDFIAQHICGGIAPRDILRYLGPLRDRGICQQYGDYLQITPRPLAIYLAATWWRSFPPNDTGPLLESLSGNSLAAALADQLAYLHFVPEAREIIQELCGDRGPFGRAEVLLTKEGSRLFRSLVEVNPEATADAIHRVVRTLDHERVLGLGGTERRHLVNALEKLCFWESTFERAAEVMLILASAESERWANNSSGVFCQLFHLALSGTQAPLSMRLGFLRRMLQDRDSAKIPIVVRGLGHALESNFFSRMGGVERQGSRAPLEDFNPTPVEIGDYWEGALNLLVSEIDRDGDFSAQAKEAVSTHIRPLISHRGFKMVSAAIRRVIAHNGSWPEAGNALRESLKYEGQKMSEALRNQIQELIDLSAPRSVAEKIRFIVSIPDWDAEFGSDGQHRNVAAEKAQALADELVAAQTDLNQYMELFLVGEQRQGFAFGQRLAQIGVDAVQFIAASLATFRRTTQKDRNVIVLAGFFWGLPDRALLPGTLENVAKENDLVGLLVELTRLTGPSEEDIDRILVAVDAGKLKIEQLRPLAINSVLSQWTPESIEHLGDKLRLGYGLCGAGIAFYIVYLYSLHQEERRQACTPLFKRLVKMPNILDEVLDKNLSLGHPWSATVCQLLKEASDEDLAKVTAAEIVRVCGSQKMSFTADVFVQPVLNVLLKGYLEVTWPILSQALLSKDWFVQHHLADMLGDPHDKEVGASLLTELPLEFLRSWCQQTGAPAAIQLARLTPVLQKTEDNLTWHPLAQMLLKDFGDEEKVLRSLTTNLGTFSWTGSILPYYEQQLVLMKSLKDDPHVQVRNWAQEHIRWLDSRIAIERNREEAEGAGIWE